MLAFAIQMYTGLFPSLLGIAALMVADEHRCPVAFPSRSFATYLFGAAVALVRCEYMCGFENNHNRSFVLWGCLWATPRV